MRQRAALRADTILDVVIELLESEGYEAVQVRTVAARARVSLATIYKLFETREQLIASAVERWMEANAYAELTMPTPDESPYESLVRLLRSVFQPWEQHPGMLEAFHRARSGPKGDWLTRQGMAISKPMTQAALKDANPEYVNDLWMIFIHVQRALIDRFVEGEIEVTDILPILERTLFRLTADEGLATGRSRPRSVSAPVRSKVTKPRRATTSRRQRSA
jgi:TetR/AcrR family transcriptional regulator, cholesterol catabolism regulator